MDKKGLILIGIGLLLGIALLVYSYMTKQEDTIEIPTDNRSEITKDNFTLSYDYKGESKWTYKVVGTLPNPCYKVSTEGIVAESYPEQVTISVNVEEPNPEEMCIQVIQEYEYEGEFSASGEAKVTLQVRQ